MSPSKNTMTSHDDVYSKSVQAQTYEEAISLTGLGKFHYRILICCGLCLITLVMESLNNAYVMSSAQCDFHMSSSDKGLLTSIVYVGIILSAHTWGFLADTQGRRKVLMISLCLDIICSLLASIAPTFLTFVILRFFNGYFISCASSVAFVYLGEFHSDKTRSKSMVLVCAFFAIGNTGLPALAWLVIPQKWSFDLPWCSFNSWRIFVLLCSVPAMLSCLSLWLFVPESPKYLLAAGRKKEALAVLQRVYSLNTSNDPDLYPVIDLKMDVSASVHATKSISPIEILKHMWEQTKPVFMPPYLISTILACCIQFGLYATSNGIVLWMPEILNQMNEYSLLYPNESATICTAFGLLHETRLNALLPHNIIEVHNETFGIPLSDEHFNESMDTSLYPEMINTIMTQDNTSTRNRSAPNVTHECQLNISYQSFLNTLIIGAASGVGFVIVACAVKFIKKKTILLVCLTATGCCGIALYFARTTTELIVLPTFFFVFPAMCISVINNLVVDAFPTRLRAMALGLSLMMGRIGTISSSMLFGVLLEINCALIFFLLSGIVIVGGILSLFIPASKVQE